MKKIRFLPAFALILILSLSFASCSLIRYFSDNQPVPLPADGEIERTPLYQLDDWTIARASLHNHTIYSDGCRTPEDLLELARRQGMAILAYADHREGDFCVKEGSKFCITFNGIEKVGYETYFDHLNRLKAESEDIIVIAGIEVMPWFFNAGHPPNLVITNQNAHFTVYAIEDPQVYYNMPVRRALDDLKPELDPGLQVYQDYVDYIVDNGGIIHAAHVESYQDIWAAKTIHATSPPRPHWVYELRDLTGFSILPEGWEVAGAPGSYWDAALIEKLLGVRETAPWAVGDADYHGPEGTLYRATTLFYMREFTEPEIYRCMREGRMVALQGEAFQDSYVTEFSISEDGAPGERIIFGEELTVSSPPVIRFSLNREVPEATALLIRNGKVILETADPAFEYVDREMFKQNLPAVYRVQVVGPRLEPMSEEFPDTEPQSQLYTNPVFVRVKK